ncbi:MAG TPA: oxaloacetate decarboxylase [Casimicrobiaceae bacterium]|nr:oxaloacetate decarboxylase [Casimicrobiaceae bacterium]
MRNSTRLRGLLQGGTTVVAPGIYDGIGVRLVERAGFQAAYASGGAIARGSGIPDLGLLSLAEIADRLEQIVDVAGVPVIADADNGYGNALNAMRAAHAFERAGVAGFHVEDQTFPKRCGHYADKSVVPVGEMVGKLKAVRDALTHPDVVVIARTDAIAVEGFDAAIDRCHAYVEAGADVAFLDAPVSVEQIAEIARRLPGWKLINMFQGGRTPLVPVSRLRELGYNIVIIPSDLQRAAIKAMQRTLAAIARDGSSINVLADLAGFDEREALVDTDAFLARGKRYEG